MAGRPKKFNEEEVLNKAVNIFWSNGYEATSTELLLTEMDLNKGSLYHSFGSKRELFAKSIDYSATKSIKALEQVILDSKNTIEGIRNFFISLTYSNDEERNKGCFMGNTVAELNNIDSELTIKAAAYLIKLENMFHKYLEIAKKNNQLTTDTDTRVLARYLLNLWNGINITRRIYKDKNDLEPLIRLQLSVLN